MNHGVCFLQGSLSCPLATSRLPPTPKTGLRPATCLEFAPAKPFSECVARIPVSLWGMRLCSLDVVEPFGTVSNCLQLSAIVCVRSVWRCLQEMLQKVSLWRSSELVRPRCAYRRCCILTCLKTWRFVVLARRCAYRKCCNACCVMQCWCQRSALCRQESAARVMQNLLSWRCGNSLCLCKVLQRVSSNSVPQRVYSKMSHTSVPQEGQARVIILQECHRRTPNKSVQQACPPRVPSKSFKQKCLTRVCLQGVWETCPRIVSSKGVLQESVFHKNVKQ